MDMALAAAGILCVVLGLGHMSIGLVWVLPHISQEDLPSTPFGPRSMTHGMVRVTWHIVTLFALTLGGILLTMSFAENADPKTVLLRWFTVTWVAATAMAFWVAPIRGRNLRNLLRLPVPMVWLVVAALCWTAST